MIYVDTSALVPMFIREAKSESLLAWLESTPGMLAVSDWSMVEFASAASWKVRMGAITPKAAAAALHAARAFVGAHCTMALPAQESFERAIDLAGDSTIALRAGDALHLAIAEGLSVDAILCLDDSMARSARALGMSVIGV